MSLLSVSAFGADLGPAMQFKAPPAPRPFAWTGCYAGAQRRRRLGTEGSSPTAAGFARSDTTGFQLGQPRLSGYMLGGQIGCDYQFASNWVTRRRRLRDRVAISAATPLVARFPATMRRFSDTTDFSPAAPRASATRADRWLLYVKGGVAWASDSYSVTDVLRRIDFEGIGDSLRLDRGRRHRMGIFGRLVGQARIRLLRIRQSRCDVHRQCQRHHRPRERQPEHSGRQARPEFSCLGMAGCRP